MATLDATAYSHIFERIRVHAPYDLLMRLRLVNRASNASATAALFSHVIISRAEHDTTLTNLRDMPPIVLLSARGGRLPVPALPCELYLTKLPTHEGWSHTRTLDVATIVRGLHDQEFPALETVRRRVWTEGAPEAHTYVDAMRLPQEPGAEAYIDNVSEVTRRHVIVVLYDSKDEQLANDSIMNIDFCEEDVHGVFIFRASTSEGGNASSRERLLDTVNRPSGLIGVADGSDMDGEEDESFDDEGLSDVGNSFSVEDADYHFNPNRTFLKTLCGWPRNAPTRPTRS